MQSTFVLGLLAGAVSGAACAALTVLLLDPAESATSEPSKASSDLHLEVVRLREEQGRLLDRLGRLEQRPLLSAAPERTSAPEVREAEQQVFEERVRDVLARYQEAEPARPVLLPEVQQAMRVLELEREEQERLARDKFVADRIDERLERATEILSLAPQQVANLRTTMTDYSQKSMELFATARESGDFGSIREDVRGLREGAEGKLTLILSPTQMELYRESELNLLGFGPERGPGGFDFRGGFGGGDRGRDRGRGDEGSGN